jgi:hypothetical protein
MKTLSGFFSLFALLLTVVIGASLTGCALQGAPTDTEEEESTSTAATTNGDDESQNGRGGVGDIAQQMAPGSRDLGQCASCGPSPQPWQNSLHVTSEAR